MVNCGPLAAGIGLPVWDTPVNFNGFRVLAALLHGTLFIYYEYRTKYTHTSTHKKENKKNYEIHKNSIKAFKAELLNKSNSK